MKTITLLLLVIVASLTASPVSINNVATSFPVDRTSEQPLDNPGRAKRCIVVQKQSGASGDSNEGTEAQPPTDDNDSDEYYDDYQRSLSGGRSGPKSRGGGGGGKARRGGNKKAARKGNKPPR